MVCVYCDSSTEVKNSRQQRNGTYIWRRRKCKACGSIFTTRESAALDEALMVETGAKLEPFNRDRLFLAIYESCKHRKTGLIDATALTQTIIEQLIKTQHGGKISIDTIAHHAHIALSRFDPTAATFYAAYHTRVLSL